MNMNVAKMGEGQTVNAPLCEHFVIVSIIIMIISVTQIIIKPCLYMNVH